MPEPTKREVVLEGVRPIMFDRYPGDNDIELRVEEKMYFAEDGKTLVLPAANLYSFLGAVNTRSAAKMFTKKAYKNLAAALCGFVQIDPFDIPFTRSGKPIVFWKMGKDGFSTYTGAPRLKDGIPNPKVRPLLSCPWALAFSLTIFPNDFFDEKRLRDLFEKGGQAIGLGTYRGVFGKFQVTTWK